MSVETPEEQDLETSAEAPEEQELEMPAEAPEEWEAGISVDAPEQESEISIDSPAGQLGELVRFMAINIVESPDDVEVVVAERGSTVHISLRVPEEEMGKVIGRQGRIAKAMRTLVMVSGSRHNLRASLDIEG